jgi:hypothetical protein
MEVRAASVYVWPNPCALLHLVRGVEEIGTAYSLRLAWFERHSNWRPAAHYAVCRFLCGMSAPAAAIIERLIRIAVPARRNGLQRITAATVSSFHAKGSPRSRPLKRGRDTVSNQPIAPRTMPVGDAMDGGSERAFDGPRRPALCGIGDRPLLTAGIREPHRRRADVPPSEG